MAADGESSTTINVSSLSALTTALKNVSGPTTILLAPGDYGYLDLKNLDFGSEVTIKSADPSDPATFSLRGFHQCHEPDDRRSSVSTTMLFVRR